MNIRYLILALAFWSAGAWAKPQTADFALASEAFLHTSGCTGATYLPASERHGDMASCVIGDGRTVVWEVEKAREGDGIRRIRFTWFDFAVDDPTEAKRIAPHVDQNQAERMVEAFLDSYAPCLKQQVRAGFFGREPLRANNTAGDTVNVLHFHNPSLVERVIEIRPNLKM